ncbi:MAG: PEGA domain-containing protein [Candidatus Marinimicrobia bacterium]|nr:PEGA domain-containing protein [Candidatus Neomarinimicrobiota bacterium]
MKRRGIILPAFFTLVLIGAFLVIRLAQGYRPDLSTRSLRPSGLLVATSVPDGAQIYLDGKLASATNTTINLNPGEYKVEIKKEGYAPWKKTLTIKKELVTKADAYLFPTYPNLQSLTFTGALNPILSPDGQKVVFAVSQSSIEKNGLWVLDLGDRPLGLPRDPRKIVASAPGGRDFSLAKLTWSLDSKQILATLEIKAGEENILLDASQLNPANLLIDVTDRLATIQTGWQKDEQLKLDAQLAKLPAPFQEILATTVKNIQFADDETKMLYTATASAQIPKDLIPALPSTSTQPENRNLEKGKIYVYDLKEDKNFLIIDEDAKKKIAWFPTSKHLFLVQVGKITILEYDNTNWVDVYTGPFEDMYAYPFPAGNRILVLTSLSEDTPRNLYAISLR